MADSSNIDALTESLKKLSSTRSDLQALNSEKDKLLKGGDLNAIRTINRYEASMRELESTLKSRLKLEEDISAAVEKGTKITDDQWKALDKLDAKVKTAEGRVGTFKTAIVQHNEKIKDAWEKYTLLGRATTTLTGGLAKTVAGITAAGLALKALERFTTAATVRQDILVQSFRGMDEKSMKGFLEAGKGVLAMDDALKTARMSAIRLGMSVGDADAVMIKMARVAGTQDAKALGDLTSGALTVAKSLNIDVNEAVELVSQRMEKFGGTAAGAISNFLDISTEVIATNKALGATVLKSDDLSRTLIDLGRDTTVYAMDLKAIGDVLKTNTLRLEANGDSYETAFRKAQLFAKGITKGAPDWAHYFSGENMFKEFEKSMATSKPGENFMDKFGSDLDKAKPGLAKKIQEIMSSNQGKYSKVRAIEELTKDTAVGINSMNSQVLRVLGNTQEAWSVVAQQWGISTSDAKDMLDQAQNYEKTQKRITELQGLSTGELVHQTGMSKAEAEILKGDANLLGNYVRRQDEITAKKKLQASIEERTAASTAKRTELEKKIADIKDQLLVAKPEDKEGLGNILKDLQDQSAQVGSSLEANKAETEKMNEKVGTIQKGFDASMVYSGRILAFMGEYAGSLKMLGAAAVAFFFLKKLNLLDAIEQHLRKMAGGPGSGAGGGGFGDIVGNSRSAKDTFMTGFKRGGGGLKGGIRGISGLGKSLWAEASPFAKGLSGGSRLIKGAGLVGTALSLGSTAMDMYSGYKEGGVAGLAKSGGAGMGGLVGGGIGAAIGTALLPGIGTMIGGAIGNWAGEKGGQMLGDFIGDQLGGDKKDAVPAAIADAAAKTASANMGSGGDGGLTGNIMRTGGKMYIEIANGMDAIGGMMADMKKGAIRQGG